MSPPLSLREIAVALDGEVSGHAVLCPGPNHSRTDRSLSVRLSAQSPGGFVCHSFADDPFDLCRDYVASRLGLPMFTPGKRLDEGHAAAVRPSRAPAPESDHAARIGRARQILVESQDAHGTVVERYLTSRGLNLPDGMDVLRFNPQTPWRDEAANRTIFVPAMLAAMRAIEGDAVTGIHRTRLTPEGAKVDRRMLGIAAAGVIKIDPDDAVTHGIAIGEGIETVLAARQLGFRPAWALASAGAIATFPVLPGIEAITLLSENDSASERVISQCAERWHRAGREVVIIDPAIGDMNDAMRRAAA